MSIVYQWRAARIVIIITVELGGQAACNQSYCRLAVRLLGIEEKRHADRLRAGAQLAQAGHVGGERGLIAVAELGIRNGGRKRRRRGGRAERDLLSSAGATRLVILTSVEPSRSASSDESVCIASI